jgi:ribose transport system ATP-binding protein
MASANILLSLSGLGKSYAGPVLSDVHLELCRGEVHALVGENGAGKSTLSRIVAGLTRPDAGAMRLKGEPFAPATRREAEHRGVRMVMQELNLIGNLTVAENLFLGHLPHRFGWIDTARLEQAARLILEQVGLGSLDPRRLVRTLGVGHQQLVEIAAGLSQPCDLLILDEPTAALTDPEIDRLFLQIARLKSAGTSVLYISHRLEEIRRISDRISVLRDGRLIATRRGDTTTLDEIVRLMVGRELSGTFRREARPPGPVALRVRDLRCGPAVRNVSFEVRRGEILGFAGLMGSGRTETMRALFGADRREAGDLFLHGATTPATLRSPRDAVRLGIALLTENRKEQGLWLPLPIRANLTMMCLRRLSAAGGWIRRGHERDEAARWIEALSIRCASGEQPVVELSGGNQQKVVLARWLFRDCDILIFDEPTRGIDVGARFEIYQLLDRLAARGKAILVVSSDLKELLELCDRIAVMSAGRLAATFSRGAWTQEGILAAALSGYLNPGSAVPDGAGGAGT